MKKDFPLIGLGTAQMKGDVVKQAVKVAIKEGYEHIDTAQMYENEKEIGDALAEINTDLNSLWITSKVLPKNFHRTRESIKQSLKDLRLEKIDYMLLHAPALPWNEVLEAYRELVKAKEDGLIDRIGVSNFNIKQLNLIKDEFGEFPFGNQIIATPTGRMIEVEEFALKNNIHLTAYSTIMPYYGPHYMAKEMTEKQKEYINSLSKKYNKNPGQVLSKWALQLGYHIIPKSKTPERIKTNRDLFDFELTVDEVNELKSWNQELEKWFDV